MHTHTHVVPYRASSVWRLYCILFRSLLCNPFACSPIFIPCFHNETLLLAFWEMFKYSSHISLCSFLSQWLTLWGEAEPLMPILSFRIDLVLWLSFIHLFFFFDSLSPLCPHVNFLMKAGSCCRLKQVNLYLPLSLYHPVIRIVIQSVSTLVRLKAEA